MHRMPGSSARALLLAAVLTTAGCGSADGGAPAPATSAPAAVATALPPTEPEPAVTPDDAQAVSVTVAAGKVTGDTGRIEVPRGTKVRLSVTADVADEVHVHGFELTEAVSPGQSTQLEFLADQPGVFEVELHDARLVLTRLQVS